MKLVFPTGKYYEAASFGGRLLSTIALDLLESVLAHLDGAELHIAAAHVAAAIDVVREELAGLSPTVDAPA